MEFNLNLYLILAASIIIVFSVTKIILRLYKTKKQGEIREKQKNLAKKVYNYKK